MKKTFSKLNINDTLFIVLRRDKVIVEKSDKSIDKTIYVEEVKVTSLITDGSFYNIHVKSDYFSSRDIFCRLNSDHLEKNSMTIQIRIGDILKDYQVFIYKEDAEQFIRDYVRNNIFLYEEKLSKIQKEIKKYIEETRKQYFKELN